MRASSSLVAPTMEADEGNLDWTSDKLGDLDTQWMMKAGMNQVLYTIQYAKLHSGLIVHPIYVG